MPKPLEGQRNVSMTLKLPKPNEFGDYIFRENSKMLGGIWASKQYDHGSIIDRHTWFVSMEDLTIWERTPEGYKLKMFHTPKEALDELNKRRR